MKNRIYFNTLLAIICIFYAFSADAQTYFEINDFNVDKDKLMMVGDVIIDNNKLSITPDKVSQTGACWYTKNKIDLSVGFDTEFTFIIE